MLQVWPIETVPSIRPGDDLAATLFESLDRMGLRPENGDVLVVCQKVVSKAEGRVVELSSIEPSPWALRLAARTRGKDPRAIEVVLRETNRIVRMDRGHLIVETGPGWVCANAGVDESNSGGPGTVVLLPLDPDASARRLIEAARERYGVGIAAIITDTFGRPWREGQIDVALGVAGIDALLDLRGGCDRDGRELHHTVLAQADALAATGGLVMQKSKGFPAAIVRGYDFDPAPGSGRSLVRAAELDLFR